MQGGAVEVGLSMYMYGVAIRDDVTSAGSVLLLGGRVLEARWFGCS